MDVIPTKPPGGKLVLPNEDKETKGMKTTGGIVDFGKATGASLGILVIRTQTQNQDQGRNNAKVSGDNQPTYLAKMETEDTYELLSEELFPMEKENQGDLSTTEEGKERKRRN